MGVDEGDVEEEGAGGIAFFEVFDGAGDAPEGVGLLLGEVVGAADPAVGGGAVGHGPAVEGELTAEPVQVFVVVGAGGVGKFEDVEAEALALGMEVELADHAGFVAGGS